MSQPVLIACAHGTSNLDGQECINRLREQIAALRPGLDVLEAYVDVQEPALPEVVAGLPAGTAAVVVPLLLSVGYHVTVDIARAVASRPDAAGGCSAGSGPAAGSAAVRAAARRAGRLTASSSPRPVPRIPAPRRACEELSGPALGRLLPQPDPGRLRSSSAQPVGARTPSMPALKAPGWTSAQVAIASYLLAPASSTTSWPRPARTW